MTTAHHSFSSEETEFFGEALAGKIANRQALIANRTTALVLALQGDLGAGKTTFTQGFLRGLGIRRRAVSPTFVIMRRYKVPAKRKAQSAKRFENVFHVDAYRLKQAEDAAALGFGKILGDPRNLVILEWPEKIKGALPKTTVWLTFTHGRSAEERKIAIRR